MKRSKINSMLKWAKDLLNKNHFKLPGFAYWSMEEWKAAADSIGRIKQTMLGWDITDFGSGDFEKTGAVLFTLRNGDINNHGCGTPYAEKVILMKEGQTLPLHYHYSKTEDIINRGGGLLVIKLYGSLPDGGVDQKSHISVYMDGIKRTVAAGEKVVITRGNSITLTPHIYHQFAAENGDLIVGEVSSINDDSKDNHFADTATRFSSITEDEPILHPLCNEYSMLFDRR
ncbi:MAG: D-lyxose/D-mannose family sugar isomerase [Christensenellales bacterium]